MRDISSWADAIYALEIDQPTINVMDFIIPTLHRPGRMVKNPHRPSTNRYTPHQGKKECARRLRWLQAGSAA